MPYLVFQFKSSLMCFTSFYSFWFSFWPPIAQWLRHWMCGIFFHRPHCDRTTLIRQRIDIMVGSPSKKSWWTWNICRFLENYWWHAWLSPIQHEHWIIIPTLSIRSENVDIQMQVRDRNANEHTALKRLGGDIDRKKKKKGWRCSLDRFSKVYRYRHQKTKKVAIDPAAGWIRHSRMAFDPAAGCQKRNGYSPGSSIH